MNDDILLILQSNRQYLSLSITVLYNSNAISWDSMLPFGVAFVAYANETKDARYQIKMPFVVHATKIVNAFDLMVPCFSAFRVFCPLSRNFTFTLPPASVVPNPAPTLAPIIGFSTPSVPFLTVRVTDSPLLAVFGPSRNKKVPVLKASNAQRTCVDTFARAWQPLTREKRKLMRRPQNWLVLSFWASGPMRVMKKSSKSSSKVLLEGICD